jgi:hypothetical protein
MKPSASELNSIDDLNAVALREEELFIIINKAKWASEIGMCPMMTGLVTIKKLFDEIPEKAKAIICRFQALSMMIENDELKNWLLADGGSVMPAIAHKALVSAAAIHPLSVINGEIAFEKESFLRRVLESAEYEGSDNN